MEYGLIEKPVVSIYEVPGKVKQTDKGVVSAIADEGLYGHGVAVTGFVKNGYVPVCTHYGYRGYIKAEDLIFLSLSHLKEWECSNLAVVGNYCADVLSLPLVQGEVMLSLFRGALIQVICFQSEEKGWAKVRLLDGLEGYIRNQFLIKKQYSQAGLWMSCLPQKKITNESKFRKSLVETACQYKGVQYRWGGKSPMGIDCSGLTSISYMEQGILIYRDASMKEGFPVHKIPVSCIKPGDLLYFPGHIAMYIGGGRYIHATGKMGSGGVVINSLNPRHGDFRADLKKGLYAVGSIF